MLLETPEIALEQTIKELEHITKISREGFTQAMTGFILSERALLHKADIKIKAVDNIYKSYKQYLMKISEKDLSIRSSIDFPILFHAAKHISKVIESIGEIIDHAEKLRARNLTIPENAKPDIDRFYRSVDSMFDHVITALSHRDAGHAEKAMAVKNDVDSMKREYRDHHLIRMQEKEVDIKAEWVTHDVNIRMERISDHLSHIANEIISDLQW
jgi:phosphate:Na+ symporter